jgi:hypothetical protein
MNVFSGVGSNVPAGVFVDADGVGMFAAAHGDTWKLRGSLLDEFSFTGGRRAI